MKNQSDRVSFKQFLKMLRPGQRPSLTQKDFSRYLRHRKRLEIFDDYEMQGKSFDARARIPQIIDATEYVKVNPKAVSKADDQKPAAGGQRFWEYWDERYGGHNSAASDKAGLEEFWRHWGTDLETVEVRVRNQAGLAYENHKENGFEAGAARYLKDEYGKWRKAETSRRRASAARIKAEKVAEAKAEAAIIKYLKKMVREASPHLTAAGSAEIEMEKKAFKEFFEGEVSKTDKPGGQTRLEDTDPEAVKKTLEKLVAGDDTIGDKTDSQPRWWALMVKKYEGNDTTREKTELQRLLANAKPETVKIAVEKFARNFADVKTP